MEGYQYLAQLLTKYNTFANADLVKKFQYVEFLANTYASIGQNLINQRNYQQAFQFLRNANYFYNVYRQDSYGYQNNQLITSRLGNINQQSRNVFSTLTKLTNLFAKQNKPLNN